MSMIDGAGGSEEPIVENVEESLSISETRSFRLLRWAVALPVAAAATAVSAFVLPSEITFAVLAGELALLGIGGVIAEIALYRTERRLTHERKQVRTQWLNQRTELLDVATRDELTQLQNRRFYYERLAAELTRAEMKNEALSILMIDVDDLKAINDEFGHLVGDKVLRSFARILNSSSQDGNVTARLGGDEMTHRHARRVARTAAEVARFMQLSTENVSEIEYAAALHDIGKIGVADSILRKSKSLDADEWKEMRRHSELGYQILKGIDFFQNAAEIVYAHHEHFDGTGYPRGLVGEEIPLGARVFAVVDAYDAMTSRRPYRDAILRDEALTEIAGYSGTQFDPKVVQAFLMVIRRSPDGFYEENEDEAVFGPRISAPEVRRTPGAQTLVTR